MTEQELRTMLERDVVHVAVPGEIYSLTLHPELCFLESCPTALLGHIAAWATNVGRWVVINPAEVVVAKPQNIDLSQRQTLT